MNTASIQQPFGADASVITQKTSANTGSVATSSTTSVVEFGDALIHKTVLTCTAFSLGSLGDEAGVGQYAGAKVYDFPEGLILTLGAVIDGAITLTSPAIDAWDGDVALGTAAPSDHATGLVAANTGRFLQSTATSTASSKVATVDAISAATGLTESGARWTDGTSTASDVYLNLLVDDEAAHTTSITGTFTGTITIVWMNLGDK